MAEMDRGRRLSAVRWLLCGVLIGAGAILPGVSGGVLAVIFDIYRPFMELLTSPRKALSKYWRGFIPLSLGWCAGFLGFAKGIAAAISLSTAVTTWLFVGLIAGTLPSLFREAGKEGRPKSAWGSLLLCAGAIFAGLYYVRYMAGVEAELDFWWYNFCGVLWGMGIVIPGMTTSSILMDLGLYQPLMEGLAGFKLLALASCLPGMLLTMALLARGVNWLFRRHYAVAFHGILGIVIASTAVIIPTEYAGAGEALLSALFGLFGVLLAFFLNRLDARSREREK